MDDVVACLLYYTVVILYMTSYTPERFRRSWFWGVTLGLGIVKLASLEMCSIDLFHKLRTISKHSVHAWSMGQLFL